MIKSVGSIKYFLKRYNPILWVVGLTLLSAGILIGSSWIGRQLTECHGPQIAASYEIKMEITKGHLWFKELISGDASHEEIWAHFDEASRVATAMLEGGSVEGLRLIPLHDPDLCLELAAVQKKLVSFREIVDERWAAAEQPGIGSDIDQRLDAKFEEVMAGASRVESALRVVMAKELQQFKTIQRLLLALCLGLGGVVGAVLHTVEKKKLNVLGTLYRSEENLSVTLNSIGDAVITTDLEGCVAGMNPVAEAMTGWTEAEAVTRPLSEVFNIIHAVTREKLETPVEKVSREGVNHTALIARDGIEYQITDRVAPILNAEGAALGVVLVFHDVTEAYEKECQVPEREKKLRCMYGVAESIRVRDTLGEVFQDVAELIPPGWHYPDLTCGRIVVEGQEYRSESFKETPWKQSAGIVVEGEPCGSLEVFYLKELPELDEGPFMSEERNLIDGIARVLGEAIEYKRRARQVGEEEQYLETIVQSLPGLFYIFEKDSARFIRRNDNWASVTGYTEAELDAMTVLEIVADRDLYAQRMQAVYEGGKFFMEDLLLTKAGEPIPYYFREKKIILDGKPCLIGVGVDLSDRKLAEEALKESESRYSLVVETIPDLVWLKDPEGFFLSCNQRFEEFFGVSEQEIVGKTDYDFVPEELADFFRANDRKAMEKGGPSKNEEWVTFASDGHRELLETIKTPMVDDDGHLLGVGGRARHHRAQTGEGGLAKERDRNEVGAGGC